MTLIQFLYFVEKGTLNVILDKYDPKLRSEYDLKFIRLVSRIVKKSEKTILEQTVNDLIGMELAQIIYKQHNGLLPNNPN